MICLHVYVWTRELEIDSIDAKLRALEDTACMFSEKEMLDDGISNDLKAHLLIRRDTLKKELDDYVKIKTIELNKEVSDG